jgi:hypothetical protein
VVIGQLQSFGNIKDNNNIAVSSAGRDNICIVIIDIESQKVMITISLDAYIYDMAVRGRTIYYCAWNKGLKMLHLSDNSVSDFPSLSTEIPSRPLKTRLSLNSHCVVPCKSQHVTAPVLKDV